MRLSGPTESPLAWALWSTSGSRIENELEGTSKESCRLGGHSVGHVALPAASLLAMKLGSYHDCKSAPAVLQALLDFAVAG
jgi:hypothetical protein